MEPEADVSVVVPVFNGAPTLHALVEAVRDVMASLDRTFEIILVDDGSADRSWPTIVDLVSRHEGTIRGFRLTRNSGQQAATYCGLLEARGKCVVTIDDDLQPHPREIRTLWEHSQSTRADVVYGTYSTSRHDLVHRLGARLLRMVLRHIAPGFPGSSSFRLIRSEVLQCLPRRVGPWVFVDPVLAWGSSEVTSVVVDHGSGPETRSRYTLGALLSLACTLVFVYTTLPLRMMTVLGLASALVSFGLGVYYLLQKLLVGSQLGFSALIVTITFSSGVVLLCLGILGEYVSRIHSMASGEPAFTVKARASR
jgi:undecaprenyl-phosphate 4-deoxy-4-formamido-L-arabinose transferase